MKILITGGAGYIGSALIPIALNNGHHVRVIDNLMHGGNSLLGVWSHPDFEFIHGDVRDKEVINKGLEGTDAVVHLAAIVGDPACADDPDTARAVNIEASKNLLSRSKQLGISRFVFASTCSNYGKMEDSDQYADETSVLNPISLYAESKVEIERAVLDDSTGNNFCGTSLRFSTVYGVSPRMRFDLTVNEFTKDMLTKKHLVVFGEQFWRPYIHVRDAARAILLVLESPAEKVRQQVFNVGRADQNFQKQTLVQLIKERIPDAEIEYVHKREDPRDYRVAFDKIRDQLGFDLTRTVPDGIREVIEMINAGIITDYDDTRYKNIKR